MAIEIEKGVPPPKTGPSGHHTKYPWHEMEVGDSFLWPSDLTRQGAYSAARNASRANGASAQFKAHQTKDGIRIWRTA